MTINSSSKQSLQVAGRYRGAGKGHFGEHGGAQTRLPKFDLADQPCAKPPCGCREHVHDHVTRLSPQPFAPTHLPRSRAGWHGQDLPCGGREVLPKCGKCALSTSISAFGRIQKNAVNVAVNRHHIATNLTSHRATVYLWTIHNEWDGLTL